jgi:hypothetical protein
MRCQLVGVPQFWANPLLLTLTHLPPGPFPPPPRRASPGAAHAQAVPGVKYYPTVSAAAEAANLTAFSSAVAGAGLGPAVGNTTLVATIFAPGEFFGYTLPCPGGDLPPRPATPARRRRDAPEHAAGCSPPPPRLRPPSPPPLPRRRSLQGPGRQHQRGDPGHPRRQGQDGQGAELPRRPRRRHRRHAPRHPGRGQQGRLPLRHPRGGAPQRHHARRQGHDQRCAGPLPSQPTLRRLFGGCSSRTIRLPAPGPPPVKPAPSARPSPPPPPFFRLDSSSAAVPRQATHLPSTPPQPPPPTQASPSPAPRCRAARS